MAVTGISAVPATGRKLRQPQHTWLVRQLPFAIQPVCIAPVLPGETLKNALFQVRAVTMPLKSPLIGWWFETYLFYVKHRALAAADQYTNMMLDPATVITKTGAANPKHYVAQGQIPWVEQCLRSVVETFFRDEGQAWNAYMIDGLPAASIQHNSWLDSTTTVADATADDFNVDLNANSTITAGEVSKALLHWEFLRANNLTDMSYEDYLRSFGVRAQREEVNQPELIRYSREWQYPSNTVDPATGAPSSAVSWAISERADKDRFFREPGFIFGVCVVRPKVYLSAQDSAAVAMMDDAYAWLPAIMRGDPQTSIKMLASGNTSSPLGLSPATYYTDVRDLLLYGDQWVVGAEPGAVALPSADLLNKRYPTKTDVDNLFIGSTDDTRGVRHDGVLRLSILGTQVDTTPRGSALGFTL